MMHQHYASIGRPGYTDIHHCTVGFGPTYGEYSFNGTAIFQEPYASFLTGGAGLGIGLHFFQAPDVVPDPSLSIAGYTSASGYSEFAIKPF